MLNNRKTPYFTLLMLISFASVNAVLFTPALPEITHFFTITEERSQLTITWFLIGYAVGQLLYGPLANRYGRKPALYLGISLQIFSSLLCVYSGFIHHYYLLIIGRFLLALGSGVGLKMTFTLVNECYDSKLASQKISYLMLAFAVTPAIGVAIGGFLITHFNWMSCFYSGAIYGILLLFLIVRLPETKTALDYDALKIDKLINAYTIQFKNIQLIGGGFLMGCSTSFIYIFAALAPYIAIELFGMSSESYGIYNLLPAIGLMSGSFFSAQLTKKLDLQKIIVSGIIITGMGLVLMVIALYLQRSIVYSIFLPMIIIYFGLSFIVANISTVIMNSISDKSHGSAVMNFINMGVATIAVLSLSLFNIDKMLLPIIYFIIFVAITTTYKFTIGLEAKKLIK